MARRRASIRWSVPAATPACTLMSATTSFSQSGTVFSAFQIWFFSSTELTVPLKYSLPSRSSAPPCMCSDFAV